MLTYVHPYVEANIYDNSETFQSTTSDGSIMFTPYFSEKGKSNKLEIINDLATFLQEKGKPNYKKYGQASYNIINWLRGGGVVAGIRLVAEDASYANTVFNVKTKVEVTQIAEVTDPDTGAVTTPASTVKKILIKHEFTTIDDLVDIKKVSLEALVDNLPKTDDEGYDNHYLFCMSVCGHGDYGNNFSIRIGINKALTKTYDFAVFNLTTLETNNGGSIKVNEGALPFSFYPDAMSAASSTMNLQQVVSDYFKDFDCYYNDEAYDEIIDLFIDTFGMDKFPEPNKIDFINGKDISGKKYEDVEIDTGNAVNIGNYSGIYLESGSNGSFDTAKGSALATLKETLLKNVYDGLTDKNVFDSKQFPIDVVLDANFNDTVKNAIVSFVEERKDCIAILDTNEQASAATTVTWRNTTLQVDSIYAGIFGQALTVYDSYTAQDILVTPTYFLASKIPSTDLSVGVQYPFVGPNRGVITGFKELNWNPDEYEKEDLYDARINYIEKNYKETKFMSQLTSQSKTTSLSDINHVRVLLKIIRTIKEISERYLFELATTETLNNLSSDINNNISSWVTNGACTVCSAQVTQSTTEKENKIARVTTEIVFTDVIERIIIDMNVGR